LKPEEIFGINAGKVWKILKNSGPLSARDIANKTGLKITDVYAALGWLGREGKIEIIPPKKPGKGKTLYILTE